MNVSSAGGMIWSAVPITAQDGMVFQAGGPGRLGERAGRERPLAGRDGRGLAGGGRWRSIRGPESGLM